MIGLLSDSHGDLAAIDAAYTLLSGKGAERFLFAGGRYSDIDEWIHFRREKERGGQAYSDQDFLADVAGFLSTGSERLNAQFTRTPERGCSAYGNPAVPRSTLDMLGDTLVCLVHDKDELTRDEVHNCLLFVHGRAEAPGLVRIGPRYFLTPGSLHGVPQPSCGVLELEDNKVLFSAFALDGRPLIERQVLAMERRTKLQVK